MTIHNIKPVPAPRMVKSDSWKRRPCVLRYFNFKDEVRKLGVNIPESDSHIIFHMAMPNSWSKKKKASYHGKPHQQKPDCDNLFKALADACYENDSFIWDVRITKVWSFNNAIEII